MSYGDYYYKGHYKYHISYEESASNDNTIHFNGNYHHAASFAALKDDGSVVTWGNSENGGDSSFVSSDLSSGVTAIYSCLNSFAAVNENGKVITWGWSGDIHDVNPVDDEDEES
jgi:hypothetical protein